MKKVLVIDDSAIVRAELQAIIANLGCQVFEAENGEEAFAVAAQHRDLALIVTDLHMPTVDGLTFCKNLHEAKLFSGKAPTIVIVTTEVSQQLKDEAKRYGVTAWILKPYEPARVAAYFSKLLGVPHAR